MGSVVARMAQRLSPQGYTEPDAFNETQLSLISPGNEGKPQVELEQSCGQQQQLGVHELSFSHSP